MEKTDNKSTLEVIGMQWAGSLLINGIEWVSGIESFPTDELISQEASAALIVGHAHIQQYERMATLKNERLEALVDAISGLTICMSDLVESVDCASAKASLADGIKLTALNHDQAIAALKLMWLCLNPNHTEAEYVAAIVEFEKLLGL